MAISAATVWEVRPTNGSDTNGGGFVAGASGTDWSQQNTAQYAATDIVTNGSSTITSASSNWGTDVVGNLIYIAGGTGSITGAWYQISARVSASNLTLDRSTGLTTGTGATGNVGGALKTLSQLATNMIGSNKAYVKAESTITSTATITFGAGAVTPSETTPATRIYGYTTTREDFGQVSITLSTNTGLTALSFTNSGWCVDGFNINCSSLGTSIGITLGNASEVRNCKVSNFTSKGINLAASSSSCHHCEVTGGTSAATAGIAGGGSTCLIASNWVHDNAGGHGMQISGDRNTIRRNVVSNNSGSAADGINCSGLQNIFGNVVYKNGRDGIRLSAATSFVDGMIRNNIITDQTAVGAAGLKCLTAALPADPRWDGNFFYNNTSNRVNFDDTSTNAIDGVNPYTNTFDVVLSATPWNNAGSNDFTLNTTVGGGLSVRTKGLPGVGGTLYSGIPGLTTSTGYLDGGVFQHRDPPVGKFVGVMSIGTY